MPDRLSPEERSAHMRRIRKTDTKPEVTVRRLAHALGFRFRLHRRDLPGTPDIVFPRLGKIILVHGCFWHQHKGCRLARPPKSPARLLGAEDPQEPGTRHSGAEEARSARWVSSSPSCSSLAFG